MQIFVIYSPDATCTWQVSLKSGHRFWRRKLYKDFTILISTLRTYWSCDLDHLYKLRFPLRKDTPHDVWLLIGLAVSEEMLEHCLNTVNNDDNNNDDGRRSMGILKAHVFSLTAQHCPYYLPLYLERFFFFFFFFCLLLCFICYHCSCPKRSPRTSSIVQIIFVFSFVLLDQ